MQSPQTLYTFLFGAMRLTRETVPAAAALARGPLQQLGLSRSSAEFLGHILAWWFIAGRRPFWKFNEPCAHTHYKPGDSWLEELGIGIRALRSARSAVATKVTTGSSRNELMATTGLSSLAFFWTDRDRVTYYEVREELLCKLLCERLGVTLVVDDPVEIVDNPGLVGEIRQPVGAPAKKRAPAHVTYSSITKPKEEEGKTDSAVFHIAQALQQHGVYEVPAVEIAIRAHSAGMNAEVVVAVFEAHVESAARSQQTKDPVAVATWRLRAGQLTPPVERARSPQAERFIEALQEEAAPPACDAATPADEGNETDPSALAVLWRDVLADLQGQMTRATFDQLLASTWLKSSEGERVVIGVAREGAVEWLERRLSRAIEGALSYRMARPVHAVFVCAAPCG
jgi:hypothetical protein